MARIDCVRAVKAAVKGGTMTDAQATSLLQRMQNMANQRVHKNKIRYDKAIKDIAGEIKLEAKWRQAVAKRNILLSYEASQALERYVNRFDTVGEGLKAFWEGTAKPVEGGRLSVDALSKSIHHQYLGRLIADLESEDLWSVFRKGEDIEDVYREMSALGQEGGNMASVTGNEGAFKIAKIVDSITEEMVARQNRAGAFIKRAPGYIHRQTHDIQAIRALGRESGSSPSMQRSFEAYKSQVLPLLDEELTFEGRDPEQFLRLVHEALYTGKHGRPPDEAEVVEGINIHGTLGKKLSRPRVLHFKGPKEALAYNQLFGIREFKDQVLHDLFYRSRAIALLETLGPNPELTWQKTFDRLVMRARSADDSAQQMSSLETWKVSTAADVGLGKVDVSTSPSMHRVAHNIRSIATMAKMGAVVLSALPDKMFYQTEMAYQGISQLDALLSHIRATLPGGNKAKRRHLRLLGVALDGVIGNTISRFAQYNALSGKMHSVQQKFFDLSLLNLWTDSHKAAAGDLMAAHLGEHAGDAFEALPEELRRIFKMYEIDSADWDIIRRHSREIDGDPWVTPEAISGVSDDDIDTLLKSRDLKLTDANRQRQRDRLETALRAYFIDRVDHAVPTAGAAERKYLTLGTQTGTPLGEAVRMLTLFKSFPITVLTKIWQRERHGRGAGTFTEWLTNDHKGKFWLTFLVAGTTVGGYLSGAIKDLLKGREPKPLVSDGEVNMRAITDAAMRGGGLGIYGDMLFTEYDRQYRSFLGTAAGPVLGQLDPLMALPRSEHPGPDAAKLVQSNLPFMNLFYIRPALDYLIFWNMNEMLEPGYLRRMEDSVLEKNKQEHWFPPSEHVN